MPMLQYNNIAIGYIQGMITTKGLKLIKLPAVILETDTLGVLDISGELKSNRCRNATLGNYQ
jgi:hypothetical protein